VITEILSLDPPTSLLFRLCDLIGLSLSDREDATGKLRTVNTAYAEQVVTPQLMHVLLRCIARGWDYVTADVVDATLCCTAVPAVVAEVLSAEPWTTRLSEYLTQTTVLRWQQWSWDILLALVVAQSRALPLALPETSAGTEPAGTAPPSGIADLAATLEQGCQNLTAEDLLLLREGTRITFLDDAWASVPPPLRPFCSFFFDPPPVFVYPHAAGTSGLL
jgi:hypothetical protein